MHDLVVRRIQCTQAFHPFVVEGQEENPSWTKPQAMERSIVFKYLRRIGEQGTIPEPVFSAIQWMQLNPGIKIDAGSLGVFSIDHHDIAGLVLPLNGHRHWF